MVTWYEVDPFWPQKPAAYDWRAVPGVAVDNTDRVWILTRSVPPVQVYDAGGEFLLAWDSEPWRTWMLSKPHYLRIDHEQNVWVCDVARHVVHKCTQDGKLLMTLGTTDQPGQDQNHFNEPTDVAVTAQGDLFVSDGYKNNRVVHYDAKGRFLKEWGRRGIAPGEFNLPHAIAADSGGRLYVADRSNARVQVFDAAGRFLAEWRDIIVPWGIWITRGDEVWVCGSSPMPWRKGEQMLGMPPKDQLFMKFDPDGKLLHLWTLAMSLAGSPKGVYDDLLNGIDPWAVAGMNRSHRRGEVNWGHGIALDSKGNVYLGDIMGRRVQKFVRHTDPRAWLAKESFGAST